MLYCAIITLKGGDYVSNKELAVQLYCAYLQASITLKASPNNKASTASMPNFDTVVDDIKKLTEKLSTIGN